MKKLFISQPMRGKTEEEILVAREKAIAKAKKLVGEPIEVIDSFFSRHQWMQSHSGIWVNL